jgi:hypothetical protein
MLRWFLQRQIAAFERTWNYDASYMHEVIDVDQRAMLAFGKLRAMSSYRKGVKRRTSSLVSLASPRSATSHSPVGHF